MKKICSALFGARADELAVSTPLSSPEERKLDAIWSRYLAVTSHPTDYQPRREDCPQLTQDWLQKLREDRRFIMAMLPVRFRYKDGEFARENGDTTHEYPKVLRYPLRSEMREAGGFAAYCLGEAFAASIRDEVEDWQREAFTWSRDEGHQHSHHERTAIDHPDIEVHLLDPEAAELVKVKLPRWPFPPPSLPPPAPAKLIPPQPRPGIARALDPPAPKKGRSR